MRDVGELKLNRDDTPKDETSASWHDCPVHPGQLWGRRARPAATPPSPKNLGRASVGCSHLGLWTHQLPWPTGR